MQPLLQRAFLCTAGRVGACARVQLSKRSVLSTTQCVLQTWASRDSGSNRGMRQGGGGCALKGLGRLLWQVLSALADCAQGCVMPLSQHHMAVMLMSGGAHVTEQHRQHQRRCTSLLSGRSWLVPELMPP